jgi:arylsulfatase A-like enzyme
MGKSSREKRKRKQPVGNNLPTPKGKRRWPWAAGVISVVLALLCLVMWPRERRGLPGPLKAGSAKGFNVLVITLDTVRADHLGCYGFEQIETPALDALADSGVRFMDAVTVCPVTLPAHATIFTGLYPPNHSVRHNAEFHLEQDQETLAEIISHQGYETAAFVSAFVLDARFGLNQGFELYDDDISVLSSATIYREGNERPAGSVTRAAVNWLNTRERSRPFFAWVHYYDPHSPYLPPPPFNQQYADRLYDGEIAYMDSEIGRLLQALDKNGWRENTVILVVADHGEGLGEHNETTHTMLIYESTMHVPLIVSCPGLFGGSYVVDDALVSTADIFPTILELLGVEAGRRGDGTSLLAAGQDPDRAVYMETVAPYFDNHWSPLYGLRRHQDKFILAPRSEYFKLRLDPDEQQNLCGGGTSDSQAAQDSLAAELSELLARWPSLEDVSAGVLSLDPETRQRLSALGYVGSQSHNEVDEGVLPDPKDAMGILRFVDAANTHFRAGRLDQALTVIRKAETLSPRNRTVLRTLGTILLFSGRDREAEEALRAANAILPHPDACLLLAQMMIKQNRDEEALGLLDQAAKLDPRHGGVPIARGDLLARQGLRQEALAAYSQAAEIDPYRVGDTARARISELRRSEAGVPPEELPAPE